MEQKAKPLTTIDLNGHKYDARTGRLLSTPEHHKVAGSLDIVAPKRPHAERRTAASKQVHKPAEHSHTLMRSAVKKPRTVAVGPTQAAIDVLSGRTAAQSTPEFHGPNDARRTKRAGQISQNSLVSKFGDMLSRPVSTTNQPASDGEVITRHVAHLAVVPAPPHAQKAVVHVAQAAVLQAHPGSAANRLLDRGMRAATSHSETAAKKPTLRKRAMKNFSQHNRLTKIAASSMAVVLLGAFFAYQNMPNLMVRYAGLKSGISASLPDYQPSGFSVNNHVQYGPGHITVSYRANADNRSYALSQAKTALNNDTLKAGLASATGSAPQTYPANGNTIYLYGDSNASWIKDGVLYNIDSKADLTTGQLINIATSL